MYEDNIVILQKGSEISKLNIEIIEYKAKLDKANSKNKFDIEQKDSEIKSLKIAVSELKVMQDEIRTILEESGISLLKLKLAKIAYRKAKLDEASSESKSDAKTTDLSVSIN